MARSKRTGLEYAVKLFASRAAFDVESTMYASGSASGARGLAQFLPQVRTQWSLYRFTALTGALCCKGDDVFSRQFIEKFCVMNLPSL